jgi:enamine deaminase RidA (YjgF/YER057c/UK114 family)
MQIRPVLYPCISILSILTPLLPLKKISIPINNVTKFQLIYKFRLNMPVQTIDPPTLKSPHPLYSSYTSVPISTTAVLVTISGQVAQDPQTGETPSELSAQVELCLSRLSSCLDHAGATKADITRFMYYIAQRAFDEIDEKEGKGVAARLIGGKVGAWLEGHRPASCFLRVFGMSDDKFLCEFECQAIVATR